MRNSAMSLPLLDQRSKFLIVVAFLVVSVASLRAIPFMQPLGGDLHNLVVYQKCSNGASPYSIPGQVCGDVLSRSLVYPPLLYHSFFWLRDLGHETAFRCWVFFQISAFGGVFYALAKLGPRLPPARSWEVPVFAALLLLQYPFAFSLERGGSDVWVILLATGSVLLVTRQRWALAGAALGVATAYKLYPGLACVIVALAIAAGSFSGPRADGKRRFWTFCAGAAGAFAFVFLTTFELSVQYFSEVLPNFAGQRPKLSAFSHSLPSAMGGGFPGFSALVFGGLAVLWIWASSRALRRGDVGMAIAGPLAICTYPLSTSFDYNLITVYPLLFLTFLQARETGRWGVLALGLVAICGERQLFADSRAAVLTPEFHVALQLAFLCCAALATAVPPEDPLNEGAAS
jgi:hypothetical protein